jgi:hypothetical protein
VTPDDDDEPKYPPPQFISKPTTPEPPPVDDAWTTATPPPEGPGDPPSSSPEPAMPGTYPTVVVDEWSTPPSTPLLPATYSENDLRTAIGSPAMPEQIRPPRRPPPPDDVDEDADDGDRPRSRKTLLVAIGSVVVGVAIAATVFVGRLNGDKYQLSCRAKDVVAEQGRTFPPWGTSTLGGDEWKPIPIPPSFQCVELETEDVGALHDAYRKVLVDRADAMLTAREVTEVDAAAAMLEQALLHARSDRKSDADARRDIKRMLGDVGYWRASAQLQKASGELADAAKQFDTASSQLPRHVSDASAWAAHIRKLVDELKAGPAGTPTAAFPPSPQGDRPPAPPGGELPVAPDAGVATPAPAAPDAAPPSGGGVLL